MWTVSRLLRRFLMGLQVLSKIMCANCGDYKHGILGVTSDLSIFDPGSSIAAEFYVSLHELMAGLESRSGLMWSAISTLHHACRNPSARVALIHTYKYTPILTKLLGSHLIQEKRLRVLQLLQELTYGIRISWQEAHLPQLITTLTQWIEGNEKDVIGLALGVLVNLCYKNLPAVYTLMRSVDSKQFLRTILKLQGDNINTRVQVCKLLIILEHISGEIPDSEILNFVNMTYSTLGNAFKSLDVYHLKHVVDFFLDVQTNTHSRGVLLKYEKYVGDTSRLLELVNSSSEPECVSVLFEFLESLVMLQVPGLSSIYPDIVKEAMNWIPTNMACTKSLQLICTIAMETRKEACGSQEALWLRVLEQLDHGLSRLLLILDTGGDENFPVDADTRTRLTSLIQLLQEMSKTSSLKQKILDAVNSQAPHALAKLPLPVGGKPSSSSLRALTEVKGNTEHTNDISEWCFPLGTVIQKVFQPLLCTEVKSGDNFFQSEVTALYVHSLDLMSDLASHDAQWLNLYSGLLQHKQVQMVLAVALYTGSEIIKKKVLSLTSTVGFPSESINSLAKSLCDLEPLVLIPSSGSSKSTTLFGEYNSASAHDMTPMFSLAQEGCLDQFIARLQEMAENNKISDISTSAVMELYEYKLASMSHSERALQSSLEAANTHSTHLQHRLAQLTAEISRRQQLLFHTQQCLEGLREEKAKLLQRINDLQVAADEAYKKNKQEDKNKQLVIGNLTATIESLRKNLDEKKEELMESQQSNDELKRKNEEAIKEIQILETNNKESTSKISELNKMLSKMEDRMNKRDRVIQEKDAEISKLSKNIEAFTAVQVYNQTCVPPPSLAVPGTGLQSDLCPSSFTRCPRYRLTIRLLSLHLHSLSQVQAYNQTCVPPPSLAVPGTGLQSDLCPSTFTRCPSSNHYPSHEPDSSNHYPIHEPDSSNHYPSHEPDSSIHYPIHEPDSSNHYPSHEPDSSNHYPIHEPDSSNHYPIHEPDSSNHYPSHEPDSSNHYPSHEPDYFLPIP
uniref:CIP2A N-terminal domain-containing protein n=1 Tax=Timema shepardi TaxID=629360 RepID=A0A7R9FZ22_TIMSH|nr:unnamed protein product [Timema shepardi]